MEKNKQPFSRLEIESARRILKADCIARGLRIFAVLAICMGVLVAVISLASMAGNSNPLPALMFAVIQSFSTILIALLLHAFALVTESSARTSVNTKGEAHCLRVEKFLAFARAVENRGDYVNVQHDAPGILDAIKNQPK